MPNDFYRRCFERATKLANLCRDQQEGFERAERYLKRRKIGTFGVESVSIEERCLEYLNTGDTYSLTVGCEDGKFFLTSWGDWYEDAENEHCMREGVMRCAWCSEFTLVTDCDHWEETVCEACGKVACG